MTRSSSSRPKQHPPGATVWLGGRAFCAPKLRTLLTPIEEVEPWPGNPRRGDQEDVTSSIRDLGLYAGVVTQASTGRIIVGNHRYRGLVELEATKLPVTPLEVTDAEARVIVARDNRTSDRATYDLDDLVALLQAIDEEGELELAGYVDEELDAFLEELERDDEGEGEGSPDWYTRKHDPIQYVPQRAEPPAVSALVDSSKTDELLQAIDDAGLDEDLAAFLRAGAQRHLVFDYAEIAELYAHAAPEVQRLMEASALVLVDYDDALRHGYVRLSSRLQAILEEDTRED